VAPGQRTARSRGRPGAKWSRRGNKVANVSLTWFASRWRNHQPKRAEKPHSKFSARKTLDGPATRPKTPLAVENSVGKLAVERKQRRLMSARERECGELPPPICPCLTARLGRDFFCTHGVGGDGDARPHTVARIQANPILLRAFGVCLQRVKNAEPKRPKPCDSARLIHWGTRPGICSLSRLHGFR